MNNFIELTTSAVARMDCLFRLIQARRANARHTLDYLASQGDSLPVERRTELQHHLDDIFVSLDMMDADYTALAGSPCTDEIHEIN